MVDLTDDDILRLGRWDIRFTRVLARVDVDDNRVVAILDTNGAQGDVPYEYVEWYFRSDDGTWHCGSGSNAGGEGGGWSGGISYAYGQADGPVAVEFRGTRRVVSPQVDGWWLYAEAAEDDDDGQGLLPRRVDTPPL